MPLFVWIGRDGPEGRERRKTHRPGHLDNMRPLDEAGRIRFAGPLLAGDGGPAGSVIVFEADDLEAATAVAARDPYVTGGVFGTWEVFGTLQVFPPTDDDV